jgi:hypothetical protein
MHMSSNMPNFSAGLVTFGDGHPGWKLAAGRLVREAKTSGYFDVAEKFSLRTLQEYLSEREINFTESSRGLGYWLWKPISILHFIRRNPDLDVVVYLDAGFQLNFNDRSIARFQEYMILAQERALVAFVSEHIESNWTKQDLLQKFNSRFSSSNQFLGGFLAGKPSELVDVCNEWLKLARSEDFHLLDDSPSRLPNSSKFVEHRHDQSILSLLLKERGAFGISESESLFQNWEVEGTDFPFWYTRHTGSTRITNTNLSNQFLRQYDKIYTLVDKISNWTYKSHA